ncbi:MAG: hypothetical protein ACYSUI_22210 [Planctomycetota bacterium]
MSDPDGVQREAEDLERKRQDAEAAMAALQEATVQHRAEVEADVAKLEEKRARVEWAEKWVPVVQEQIAGLKAILAETETYLETEKSNA